MESPSLPDRLDLYERCVQSASDGARLLRAIHADLTGRSGGARVLIEDFAGTGALSRAWVEGEPGASAIAIDLDDEALARVASTPGVRTIVGDVTHEQPALAGTGDVVFTGNFSIGYLHHRADLVAYLRGAHARLGDGGVFVCDTYGGRTAHDTGTVERTVPIDDPQWGRLRCVYTWEQREADPLSGMVTDAIHFTLIRGSDIVAQFRDAFVYRWRLWSVPELREAMLEAGFGRVRVYADLPEAVDADGAAYVRPLEPGRLEHETFIVCVAGAVGGGTGV